jgi:hypothetical protein
MTTIQEQAAQLVANERKRQVEVEGFIEGRGRSTRLGFVSRVAVRLLLDERNAARERAERAEAHFVRGVALLAALVADSKDTTTTFEILNECSASWPEMVAAGVDAYDLVRIARVLAPTGGLRKIGFYEVEPRKRFNRNGGKS